MPRHCRLPVPVQLLRCIESLSQRCENALKHLFSLISREGQRLSFIHWFLLTVEFRLDLLNRLPVGSPTTSKPAQKYGGSPDAIIRSCASLSDCPFSSARPRCW